MKQWYQRRVLCWQPFGSYAKAADLIVVTQENKLIYNQWLMTFGRPHRIAFWGHGRNMQSHSTNSWKESFKRWTIKRVDWWFAYTQLSADFVSAAAFPREKITVVDNAIDTDELAKHCEKVSAEDCYRMREQLGLGDGPIGLYLGSLYKEKRLDFLLEAAQRIRNLVPGFQFLIVGAGPDRAKMEGAARQYSWVHYLGALQGNCKAKVLVLADVMLNPGLIGLGILDSFVCGTPMFTTDCGVHSPEISYLKSGVNGVMTTNDFDAYVAAVSAALSRPEVLAKLRMGALASAPQYNIENMAERFCGGILACLASP